MTKLIIDLDELNLRELFEVRHQWLSNRVERSVRLAIPCKINMHTTVSKDNIAVTCETIVDHC